VLQLCGHSPCAYLGQSKLGVGEDMVVTTVMQANSSAGVILRKNYTNTSKDEAY
jgi:hypothetical protein